MDRGRRALAPERTLERLEAGAALAIEHDRFAVEQRGSRGQRRERGREVREAVGPVVPVARDEARRSALDPSQHPVAVELDLVEPLGSVGRRVDERRELERHLARQRRAARGRKRRGITGRADGAAAALARAARPDAVGFARDVVEIASGQDAARLAFDDRPRSSRDAPARRVP